MADPTTDPETASGSAGSTPSGPAPRQPLWRTACWWVLTLMVLVVLDDLTFGPFFWALSRLAGTGIAVAAVFAIYVPAQVALVHRGTSDDPGRLATFFLRRFDVERRNEEIAQREFRIHSRIVGAGSALALSLVIAGVLPCLLLWRRGYPRPFVLRLAVPAAILYAAEYALLHAVIPGSL
jgi:hypothetical protein